MGAGSHVYNTPLERMFSKLIDKQVQREILKMKRSSIATAPFVVRRFIHFSCSEVLRSAGGAKVKNRVIFSTLEKILVSLWGVQAHRVGNSVFLKFNEHARVNGMLAADYIRCTHQVSCGYRFRISSGR